MLKSKILNVKFVPPIFLKYLLSATSFNIGIRPHRVSDSTHKRKRIISSLQNHDSWLPDTHLP